MKRIIFILIFSFSSVLLSQQKEIKNKSEALKDLRNEINEYDKQIEESEKKEKLTIERIDIIEKQSNTINRLVNVLQSETVRLQMQIEMLQKNIIEHESQLKAIISQYSRYSKSVYKNGKVHDFELILSSNSLNQFLVRVVYLKHFTEQRKRDIFLINEKQKFLEGEKLNLQQKLLQEKNLITEKVNEFENLIKKKSQRTKYLSEIRNDIKEMERERERKIKAAKELERIIANLIEEEIARKTEAEKLRLKKEFDKKKLKEIPKYIVLPSPQIGKLPWPVQKGTITSRFGMSTHPILKTLTENNGIDISVPAGTNVQAVSDAEVSVIHWLPSYGNLLILSHGKGVRTVYANLSDIFVTKGQIVKKGFVIAKTGESISGSLLHFEVWQDKNKQNPENWLSKKR